MQLALRYAADADDADIDYVEVEVLPPRGATVDLGLGPGEEFIVASLTLRRRARTDGGRGYRTHYEALLVRAR